MLLSVPEQWGARSISTAGTPGARATLQSPGVDKTYSCDWGDFEPRPRGYHVEMRQTPTSFHSHLVLIALNSLSP